MPMKTIKFDQAKLEEFKRAWREAVEKGEKEFTFDGHLWDVEFAQLMLLHLANQLN